MQLQFKDLSIGDKFRRLSFPSLGVYIKIPTYHDGFGKVTAISEDYGNAVLISDDIEVRLVDHAENKDSPPS